MKKIVAGLCAGVMLFTGILPAYAADGIQMYPLSLNKYVSVQAKSRFAEHWDQETETESGTETEEQIEDRIQARETESFKEQKETEEHTEEETSVKAEETEKQIEETEKETRETDPTEQEKVTAPQTEESEQETSKDEDPEAAPQTAETTDQPASELSGDAEKEVVNREAADAAIKNGWGKVGEYTLYYNQGKFLKGFQKIKNDQGVESTYYFDPASGHMMTGFVSVKNSAGVMLKYYFAPDTGIMQTGFQVIKNTAGVNQKFYFDPADGHMLTGFATIPNGAGTAMKYYFDPSTGVMQTGLKEIKNAAGTALKYYFAPADGHMMTGVVFLKNTAGMNGLYYFDPSSGALSLITGWKSITAGKTASKYYFGTDGKAYEGEKKIENFYYYFKPGTGVMQTGFVNVPLSNNTTKTCYYSPSNGQRLKGQQKIGSYKYYFKSSGNMKRGFAKIKIKVKKKGKVKKKKVKVYYNPTNGRMVHGMVTIEGEKYYFNKKTGAMEWKGRRYQNPEGYYQIQSKNIVLKNHGKYKRNYTLNVGFEGLKTAWVMRKLGISNGIGMGYAGGAYYSYDVKSAVANFQRNHGLKANGKVNLKTWQAMGYTKKQWERLGCYASPLMINENSSRKDCVEAMIKRAYQYLGDDYIIGASSAPGLGCDCSGLVMQGLFAAGIDMTPINPIRHAYPGFEYESANIWATSKLKHVSYSKRKRGDIIIYSNSSYSTVIHSAIYLGKNKVIESWPNTVRVSHIKAGIHPYVLGVLRPFQ